MNFDDYDVGDGGGCGVVAAVVDLARPQPSQSRNKRSKYVQYSGEDRAKIAKYFVPFFKRAYFFIPF